MDRADMTTRLEIVLPKIYGDPFVAGVVCAKLGIIAYAEHVSIVLRSEYRSDIYQPGEARRLFLAGVAFAPRCRWTDIAPELARMQGRKPLEFAGVANRTGEYGAIMDAVAAGRTEIDRLDQGDAK